MSNKKDNTLFYRAVKSKFEVYLKKKKTVNVLNKNLFNTRFTSLVFSSSF